MLHRTLLGVFAAVPLLFSSVAMADSTWIGGVGNWNNSSNWSGGQPSEGSVVIINNGGTAQVDTLITSVLQRVDIASSNGTTGSLALASGGDLLADKIRIGQRGSGSATVTDGFFAAGGGSLFVGSDQSGGNGIGELTLNDGAVALSGDDIQFGSVGSGTLNLNAGSFINGGYVVVGKFGMGEWNQTGGVSLIRNDLEIADGGKPEQYASFSGPREGVFNQSGGVTFGSSRFALSNRIGTSEANISGGALAITGDSSDQFGDSRDNILSIGRGANWNAAAVASNGVSGNTATLRVIGDDSVIAVGLDLEMDLNNVFESSNLIAQITGPTHTPILVGRNAEISNGTFSVELNGYAPSAGDEWSIIQTNVDLTSALTEIDAKYAAEGVTLYGSDGLELEDQELAHNNNAFSNNSSDSSYVGVDGTFESLDFSAAPLAAGLEFQVEYLSDEVLLKVVSTGEGLAGDYNGNGMVDAADYTVWRDNLNSSHALGGNGDESGASAGVVDQADYTLWANNYGASSTTPAAAAVPEPTSLLISMVGLSLAACGRCGKRS